MGATSLLVVLRIKPLLRVNCYLSSLLNNNYQEQLVRGNQNILRYCMKVPNTEDSMTVITLEEAQKLAKRRNLILIKVDDEQKCSSKDTYKLVEPTEHLKESKIKDKGDTKNNDIKSIKLIQLSAKISMYDTEIKLKNVNRLLKKRHKVKLIINYDSEIPDKILKYVESSIKQHGTIQKSMQSLRAVLLITPILNKNDNTNDNSHDINVNTEEK
ncbi:PREDICTED: uncharacterized protein LOC106792229 isoform X2 [Polistes canadensis]|uniref:uncharacterized protein LOC106792229 isoform X2 n=1 Tax=Polistes canadensis TaxID=91411 RepID=UPI000718D3C3|nr:PREDICTED: uncharacterized protein LOC106792229 isoform X2 [Polistes canadensis]